MSYSTTTHGGGDWLINDAEPGGIFTPEALGDDQRLIRRTAAQFLEQELTPTVDELEKKNWTLLRSLIKRCGELGLLGTDVPEEYGGVGLDRVTAVVVAEALGPAASFASAFGAQTGLAIMPILWFGTRDQQNRYLPLLLNGDLIGAYCLSESGAGSDALAARARAVQEPDGSWTLNGEKMWITNGGLADLFIVFAKVHGEQFSAFLVERGFPGVSSGKEEHKMGLHGSSTTPLILQDAKVPAENLLGEIGRGHKIAFSVLDYGRFKLAGFCSGGARCAIGEAASYALGRRQFGQPIAAFGAIRHKLAEMTIREYGVESMLYRTAGLIDQAIGQAREDAAPARALEEFAVEASLLKIEGSEMVDFVLDENIQIHGGNGFVRDYPAERRYRDSRVNRIFEGTNEINRLLVPGLLIKRAAKGGLPLIAAARKLQDSVTNVEPAAGRQQTDDPMAGVRQNVAGLKKAALMILGLAVQTYGDRLQHEQEVLMLSSDIIRETFLSESAMLRADETLGSHSRATAAPGPDDQSRALHRDTAAVLTHDSALRAEVAARTALAAMTSGDTLRTMLAALRRFLRVAPTDTIAARRRIADVVVARKGYPF
jgi:alkylation response protein AidB-like acyl-CoA dehydrogenase